MALLRRISRIAEDAPSKEPGDDVLFVHAMLSAAGAAANGAPDESTLEAVESFFATLPELEGSDFDMLSRRAEAIVLRFGDRRESLGALRELSSPVMKRKCFALAVDAALSYGDVGPEEEGMLHAMQRVLEIDDETAARLYEVLSWKYAR
jgi:hypothetical protein